MPKLRRRRVLHAWNSLLDRSWPAHCGAKGHLRFRGSYQRLFHLADTVVEFNELTPYESAWLFLAVLFEGDEARDEWLGEFGLVASDLRRGHLMLTDIERSHVAGVVMRLNSYRWWKCHNSFI